MNIPLVNSSNDNVFFETYLIFLGILLAKVFSEVFTYLNHLDNKYRKYKKYMTPTANFFNRKSNIYKFIFSLVEIVIFWFLVFLFGYSKTFIILITSLADVVLQGSFYLLKQGNIWNSLGFCFFICLLIYISLANDISEKTIALIIGLIFCLSIWLIGYLKNYTKKYQQKFKLFK